MKLLNALCTSGILCLISAASMATPLMAHITNNSGKSLEVTYKSSAQDKTSMNIDSSTVVFSQNTKTINVPLNVQDNKPNYKFELDLNVIENSSSKENVFHLILSPTINDHNVVSAKYGVNHTFKRTAPMDLNVTINSNAADAQLAEAKKSETTSASTIHPTNNVGVEVSIKKTQTWGEWFKGLFGR